MSYQVHHTVNIVLELDLELSRWMTRTRAPRKLAGRIEDALMGAGASLDLAARFWRPGQLANARARITRAGTLIDQLRAQSCLTPQLHAWAKGQLVKLLEAIADWDPARVEPMLKPRPQPLLSLVH